MAEKPGDTGQTTHTGTLTLSQLAGASPAIALSGGAAQGDFEVGAVRYLYDHGIRPKILCGTSVGSINALKLAEGEGDGKPSQVPGHVRGLAGLEAIWHSLQRDSDMWKPNPKLDAIWKAIEAIKTVVDTAAPDLKQKFAELLGGDPTFVLGSAATAPLGMFLGRRRW